MKTKSLTGKPRTESGKNAAGRLRREGWIPANLIGKGQAENLTISEREFQKILTGGLRQSTIFNLEIEGGSSNRVFVKELQRNPVNGRIMHVDFYRATEGEKVLVPVAVETAGVAKGIKAGGALEHFIRVLKVRATPETLTDVIRVDISDLDVGGTIFLKDLSIPADWDVLMEGNPIVLKIARSRLARAAEVPGQPADEAAPAAE